jgi:hypothetical protein
MIALLSLHQLKNALMDETMDFAAVLTASTAP